MTVDAKTALRLQFFARVVGKECKHLSTTDQRLFAGMFTVEQASRLEEDPDLAERVEAFVGRFGRLQTGHAFVPTLLATARKMIAEIERRGWA